MRQAQSPMGLALVWGGLALMLLAASARAAGPADTLRARDRQIRAVLGERGKSLSPAEDAQLRALVNGIFDYENHARESFGRYWDQMNERDQAEGLRLVRTLLERSSMDKVHEYRSNAIQYVSERLDQAGAATVTTQVTRDREKWEVGYRLRQAGGQWRIVDVIVEGAGTVENNRTAFYKEIRASGIPGLLAKLRKKADQP
jgi:phospholipid transport system substrate-binding protein